MSYNNIGLSTPRGSGTNGYIQSNLSNLRARPKDSRSDKDAKGPVAHRAPDKGILEHERRRAVEVKCLELQLSLEDDAVEPDEIERQVSALRTRLLATQASTMPSVKAPQAGGREIKQHETHELALAKEAANERMRSALRIKGDHVEGRAFNKEAQQQDRLKRIEEREQREREREEAAKLRASGGLQRREVPTPRSRYDDRERYDARDPRSRRDDDFDDRRAMPPPRRGGRDYDDHSPGLDYGSKGKAPRRRSSSRSRSPPPVPSRRRRSPSDSRSPPPRSADRSRRRYDDEDSDDDRRGAPPPARRRSASPPPRQAYRANDDHEAERRPPAQEGSSSRRRETHSPSSEMSMSD